MQILLLNSRFQGRSQPRDANIIFDIGNHPIRLVHSAPVRHAGHRPGIAIKPKLQRQHFQSLVFADIEKNAGIGNHGDIETTLCQVLARGQDSGFNTAAKFRRIDKHKAHGWTNS